MRIALQWPGVPVVPASAGVSDAGMHACIALMIATTRP